MSDNSIYVTPFTLWYEALSPEGKELFKMKCAKLGMKRSTIYFYCDGRRLPGDGGMEILMRADHNLTAEMIRPDSVNLFRLIRSRRPEDQE